MTTSSPSHHDYRAASIHRLVKLQGVLDAHAYTKMVMAAAAEETERSFFPDPFAVPALPCTDSSNSCPDVRQSCPTCGRLLDWRQHDNGSRTVECHCGYIGIDDSGKHQDHKPEFYRGTARC